MIDYRWLRPSDASLVLPDRHHRHVGTRWPRHDDKPQPTPGRPRKGA